MIVCTIYIFKLRSFIAVCGITATILRSLPMVCCSTDIRCLERHFFSAIGFSKLLSFLNACGATTTILRQNSPYLVLQLPRNHWGYIIVCTICTSKPPSFLHTYGSTTTIIRQIPGILVFSWYKTIGGTRSSLPFLFLNYCLYEICVVSQPRLSTFSGALLFKWAMRSG